jgi:hypothetical protein
MCFATYNPSDTECEYALLCAILFCEYAKQWLANDLPLQVQHYQYLIGAVAFIIIATANPNRPELVSSISLKTYRYMINHNKKSLKSYRGKNKNKSNKHITIVYTDIARFGCDVLLSYRIKYWRADDGKITPILL